MDICFSIGILIMLIAGSYVFIIMIKDDFLRFRLKTDGIKKCSNCEQSSYKKSNKRKCC